jgi:hypothetical protein
MVITNNGNVGIGTTSPGAKLDITGNVRTSTYYNFNGNPSNPGDATAAVYDQSGVGPTLSGLSVALRAGSTPAEIMRVTSTGVGIGTSSPNNILHLYTNYAGSSNSGSAITITSDGSGGDNGWIGVNKGTGNGLTLGVENRDIIFQTDNTTAFNGTERMRITTDGSVGIGTTNPVAALHVQSSSTKLFLSNTDFVANTTGSGMILHTGASSGNTYSQIYAFQSGNTAYANLVIPGGNVGIGTASPAHLLSIYGTPVSDGALNVVQKISSNAASSTTPTSGLGFGANYTTGGDNAVLSGIAGGKENATSGDFAGVLNFYTRPNGGNHTERMRITSAGNVGIGTTTPTGSLQVAGDVTTLGQLQITGSVGGGPSSAITFNTLNRSSVITSYAFNVNPAGGAYGGFSVINVDAGQTMLQLSAYNLSGDSYINVPDDRQNISFRVANTPKMFISGSGNVGIGLTNPDYAKLMVAATNHTGFAVTRNGSNAAALYLGNNGNDIARIAANNADLQIGRDFIGTFTPYVTVQNDSGNVGIGTTSPQSRLDLAPPVSQSTASTLGYSANAQLNIRIPNSVGDVGQIVFTNDSAPTAGYASIGVVMTNSSGVGIGDIIMSTKSVGSDAASTERMRIVNSGNVGIGTTSPDDKLEIEGGGIGINNTSDPYLRFRESGTIVSDIFTDTSANNLVVRGSSGHGVEILANGASEGAAHLVVSGSGNVGIGTTSPSAKLEIAGFSTGAGLKLNYGNSSGTIEAVNFIANGGANGVIGMQMVSAGVGDLWLGGSGGRALTLYRDGNVGIGTTSPETKLQIQTTSNSDQELLRLTIAPANSSGAKPKAILGFYTPAETNTANYTSGRITSKFDIAGYANSRVTIESLDSGGNFIETLTAKNGNVGIGTTSPSTFGRLALAVANTGSKAGIGISNNGFNGTNASPTEIGLLELFSAGGTAPAGIYGLNTYNDTSAAWLSFKTTNAAGTTSTVMTINSSGNVGIGTTSPNTKLDVSGSISLAGTDGLRIGSVGDNSAYDNVKLHYSGYNGGAPRVYLTPRTTPGSGVIQTYFHLLNSNGTSTISNNTMGLIVDGSVGIGTTSPAYKLQVSGSIAIENQGTTTIESTTFAGSLTTNTNIASVPTASFKAAFFDYYVASGSVNMRAGTVMAVHNNSTSRYTDTSTADIGNTAAVDFSTSVVGGNLVLTANISSGTWEIKTAYRAL